MLLESPSVLSMNGLGTIKGFQSPIVAEGRFGVSTSGNYRGTFFAANPGLKGQVVVHHAVEQAVLNRFPGVVTKSEMHSLENLRGIPVNINSPN